MTFSVLASLLLHVAVLWPAGRAAPRPLPKPPPLEAHLLAPALATHPEESEPAPAEVAPPPPPTPPSRAVPSAPTLPKPAPPRELKGRALGAAMAALTKQDFYPREAIERGLEGDVIALLTLAPDGALEDVGIATSSGHAVLDAAALAAVRRIGRLPAAQRQVLLPVRFRLD